MARPGHGDATVGAAGKPRPTQANGRAAAANEPTRQPQNGPPKGPIAVSPFLAAAMVHLDRNPKDGAAFVRVGMLQPLIDIIAVHPDMVTEAPGLASHFLCTLCFLALDPQILPTLAVVVAPLAAVVRATPANVVFASPNTACALFDAVGKLAHCREIAAALARAGVVPHLVAFLGANPRLFTANPELAMLLYLAAGSTCVFGGPETMVLFHQAGVARPLAAIMEAIPATIGSLSCPATYPLFMFIGHLTEENPEAVAAFGEAGMVGPVAALLQAATPAAICARPAEALWLLVITAHLAHSPENAASFCRAGAIAPLAAILAGLPPSVVTATPILAEKLLNAVASLVKLGPEAAAADFGRAGVVPPVVGMLTAHPCLATESPPMAQSLLRIVAGLARDAPSSKALGRAGVAVPLGAILKSSHPDSPDFEEDLLCAIGGLALKSPENAASLGRAGVIGPLVGLLDAHPNPSVFRSLVMCLANLATDPENAAGMDRAGVISTLADVITTPPLMPRKDITQAFGLMARLVCGDEDVVITLGRLEVPPPTPSRSTKRVDGLGPLLGRLRGNPMLVVRVQLMLAGLDGLRG
ncbi:hypothetical protein PAPYR_6077 [Paratrimastix pyriformis]|uniref:Uncharacterized protein n=1 Tax=Paratrimastix pyriformis TaxID=342808 RepID=A0ABQ8UIL9_9EUKA|nr:hypothetical protein PAPYR_6077 [Paratrimastix pyriformis]